MTVQVRMLDLACDKGEMLCTWARDHGVAGTGVDISTVLLDAARGRAVELGVADRVGFVHADASGHVADDPRRHRRLRRRHLDRLWRGGYRRTPAAQSRSRRHDADR